MNKVITLSAAAAVLMACSTFSRAGELKFAHIFSDHAILQRDQPVPIWGWADAGAVVTVEFAGQTKTATADASGKWLVKLDALKASTEPRTLTARTTTTATVSDVLVGEVWLASGQSNMGVSLSGAHNAATELPKADDPLLRFYTVSKSTDAEPQPDASGKWEACTPVTAKNFSAVAYFFARELRAKLNYPVAVLHSSWGGTPGQAWVSMDALRKEPALAKHVQKYDEALVAHRDVQAHPEKVTSYKEELKRWQKEVGPDFNAAMKEYNAKKSTGPKPTPVRPEPANPDPMAIPSPSSRPGTPSVIFNGMIAPLAPYALRGAIWYQGEANGGAGMEYRSLLPCLIADWRAHWNQGDFTFLIVQLPGWDHDTKPAEQHDWPWLREAQLLAWKNVPKTGMAVGIDVGDPHDVHPKDKFDIGMRLALAARKVAYGETLVYSGPLFQEFKVEGSAARVKFSEIGTGLMIGQAPWHAEGVEPLPTDKLIGFTIAGDDHHWFAADAKIDGDCVVASSPDVLKPVAVRYGWANAPRCNLYNKGGLPASPFRTDDWSISGAVKRGAKMTDNSRRVLLTGATGYVGGRMLALLEQRDIALRCLARRPETLRGRTKPGTEIVAGDVLDRSSLDAAMLGVDTAYYFVHSMGAAGDFEQEDRTAATHFAQAAMAAGVRRIIYLGGLGDPDKKLSKHLRSRQETGGILRANHPHVIEFRASIVIGSGSLSFEMIRALVERLPVMICPRWVQVKAQPIAIEDLLQYLLAALDASLTASIVFEIGGPDQVSYGQIMQEYARQRGLKRWMIPVPLLTPHLSSLWLGLVTPIYARVGRKLVESLRNPTLVSNDLAANTFAIRPRSVRAAIARALIKEDREFAETRWADAVSSAGTPQTWGGVRFGSRLVDSRTVMVSVPPEQAFAPIRRIGGRQAGIMGIGFGHCAAFWICFSAVSACAGGGAIQNTCMPVIRSIFGVSKSMNRPTDAIVRRDEIARPRLA